MTEHHSVIIIGAGLSGLCTAWKLHQQQQDVLLFEARERTCGRILSAYCADTRVVRSIWGRHGFGLSYNPGFGIYLKNLIYNSSGNLLLAIGYLNRRIIKLSDTRASHRIVSHTV